MSAYILLAAGPYVGYIFQRRAKFLESLQEEWRRITAVKQDIVSYCQKGKNDLENYVELYSKLSTAIDNMRVLFRNVGESKTHIGLYPYETLHDFRRQLEKLDPRNGAVPRSEMSLISQSVVSSFQAFRDVFLIELGQIEPGFPIVVSNLKRLRKGGVDPRLSRNVERKHEATMAYFVLAGDDIDRDKPIPLE
jgi:hypothetical protein